MRLVKHTYRATFSQPMGVLNPMNIKCSAPVIVEIFKRGDVWRARNPTVKGRPEFSDRDCWPTEEAAQGAIRGQYFERALTPWAIWGEGKELQPGEWLRQKGKVYLKESEDYEKERILALHDEARG